MIILLTYILRKTKNRKPNLEENITIYSKKEIIRKIAFSAVLMAIGIILKTISFQTGQIRLGFYEVAVFLAGITLGPLYGGLVGLGTDLVYSLFSGYPFSALMMTSAIMWGLIGGLLHNKKIKYLKLLAYSIVASIVATSINSVQLYIYYGMGMFANLPTRVITMLIKWPLITTFVWLLEERVIKLIIKKISYSHTKK